MISWKGKLKKRRSGRGSQLEKGEGGEGGEGGRELAGFQEYI